MNNEQNEEQNISSDPSTVETPRKKTMSEAALAANRANAQKSTGPRSLAGKLRSASNSLKHGLFSLKNFDFFLHDNDIALTVVTNYLEQFNPITPTEVSLVHQLIHQQLRFLQMEYLLNQAMSFHVADILATPVPFLSSILRELDRLPARMARTLKLLRQEIQLRDQFLASNKNAEIEPIEDLPPLPARPKEEVYPVLVTAEGLVPIELENPAEAKIPSITGNPKADRIFHEYAQRILTKYENLPPKPTQSQEIQKTNPNP